MAISEPRIHHHCILGWLYPLFWIPLLFLIQIFIVFNCTDWKSHSMPIYKIGSENNRTEKSLICNPISPTKVKLEINETFVSIQSLEKLFPHVEKGGHWEPKNCTAKQNLGIFVPMRNRWHHLPIFLNHLHRFLASQLRRYTIYVIEQADNAPFNRGKLFNAGVIEALKLDPSLNCFVLHDIDTLPERNHTLYECKYDRRLVLQMATYQKKRNYTEQYKGYTGGVLAIRRQQYEDVNGFHNDFWGWGGEDDDLSNRLSSKGYQIVRDLTSSGRFHSLEHPSVKANPNREELIKRNLANLYVHGMNDTNYTVVKIVKQKLFTLFSVNVTSEPIAVSYSL